MTDDTLTLELTRPRTRVKIPWPPQAHDREPRIRFQPQHVEAHFELCDPLWRYVKSLGVFVFVPQGYLTDLASIPFWARPIMSVTSLGVIATAVHDMLYCYRGTCLVAESRAPTTAHFVRLTRKTADNLLAEIAEENGRTRARALTARLACRLGGNYRGPAVGRHVTNLPEWRRLWTPIP